MLTQKPRSVKRLILARRRARQMPIPRMERYPTPKSNQPKNQKRLTSAATKRRQRAAQDLDQSIGDFGNGGEDAVTQMLPPIPTLRLRLDHRKEHLGPR